MGREVATDERFVMANGIAISDDRSTVYVVDSVAQTITSLKRGPSGNLVKVGGIKTKDKLDNIEVGADGALYGGSIPLTYTCHPVCQSEADFDGR